MKYHGIFPAREGLVMLTDTKLRNLKPEDKLYKVNDRDGLDVALTPAGGISFRYNYSISVSTGDADDRPVWQAWRYAFRSARTRQRSKEDDCGREVTGQGKGSR